MEILHVSLQNFVNMILPPAYRKWGTQILHPIGNNWYVCYHNHCLLFTNALLPVPVDVCHSTSPWSHFTRNIMLFLHTVWICSWFETSWQKPISQIGKLICVIQKIRQMAEFRISSSNIVSLCFTETVSDQYLKGKCMNHKTKPSIESHTIGNQYDICRGGASFGG